MRVSCNGGKRVALSPHPNNAVSTDHKMTAQRLDEDEVSRTYLTDSMGRKQSTTVINESGLYNVILRSDKPETLWAAILFKWFNSILNYFELIIQHPLPTGKTGDRIK